MLYHPPFGSSDPDASYVDGNVAEGISGSRVPALAIESPQREIVAALVQAGLTPEEGVFDQLAQAIILPHRIQEDMDVFVPGQYATIRAALSELSYKLIRSDVTVVINVEAGHEELLDIQSASIFLAHSFGNRIRIKGPPLQTGFPGPTDANLASATDTENMYRLRWRAIIRLQGLTAGLFMSSGAIDLFENVLIIGDGTVGQHGAYIGQRDGGIGSGSIAFRNVAIHRCGGNGLRADVLSGVQTENLVVTHCTGAGIQVVNNAIMYASGRLMSFRNGGGGATMFNGGRLIPYLCDVAFRNNGGSGVTCTWDGAFNASQATSLVVESNAAWGVICAENGRASLKGFDGGGNTSGDLSANQNSVMSSSAAVSVTGTSPALNTVGNNNSYIASF